MTVRQYIGARYVPKFYENSDNTAEWRAGVIYEPLTIVTYNGNSYTSKKTVPANIGNPSANPSYWVATGVFNEQLENVLEELQTVHSDINDTNNVINHSTLRTLANRRFVIIGDSYLEGYTPDGDVTSWGELLVAYLGLDVSQYEMRYRGGAGFIANGQGKNFLDLLNDSSIENPETVTDVIVSGGYNDYSQTAGNIASAIATFANTCRIKYPNAKIWCGHCGWTKDSSKIYQMGQCVRNYIEGCSRCGIAYLTNIENAMHRYFEVFASDGVHANANGQRHIAEMTADILLGGGGDMYGAYLTMVFTPANEDDNTNINGNLATTLRQGAVTIMTQVGLAYTFATPIASYGAGGATLLDLGTISGNSYAVGCNYNLCNVSVPAFVKADGVYHRADANLIFKNGHIYVTLKALNDGGTAWRNFTNIQSIEFDRFAMTMDAKLC